jgi:hypothetical protein
VKRKYAVYLVQAIGLLCIAAGLYLGWVHELAAHAAAIRGGLSDGQLAVHTTARFGLPGALVSALRGPAFWLGLVIVVAAPWLPIPDSQGRRAVRTPRSEARTADPERPSITVLSATSTRLRPRPPFTAKSSRGLEPRVPRA